MHAILAVDPGGTKCDALLADTAGHILGWGKSDIPGEGGRTHKAAYRATRAALTVREFESLHVVALGENLPLSIFSQIETGCCEILPCNEATAAMAHAGVKHGCVLLAGTGAFAHGRTRDGRAVHLDGSGPILGDFGGGYNIGLMALHAAVRADWHERHATTLRERILTRFAAETPYDLFRLNLFARDRSLVASLAKTVVAEATAGDRVARQIIEDAVDILAETFRDLVVGLDLAGEDCPIVGTGSLIRCADLYWGMLWERVHAITPRGVPYRLTEPPAVSLAILALRHIHGEEAEPAVAQIKTEFRQRTL